MDFTITQNKTGKANRLFNNFKFRESYTLKGGEIIWRCLGAKCKATIKTDALKSQVVTVNTKHSGQHPVTMRSLQSPADRSPSASPASTADVISRPPAATSVSRASTPAATSVSPAAAPASAASPALSSSTPVCRQHAHTPTPEPTHTGALQADIEVIASPGLMSSQELVQDNNRLREEISALKQQIKSILDHSIESDTRLLQYTNEVFAVNRLNLSQADCGTSSATSVDVAIQCDELADCSFKRCVENRALLMKMRTTIEVLEAEVHCLRTDSSLDRGCKKHLYDPDVPDPSDQLLPPIKQISNSPNKNNNTIPHQETELNFVSAIPTRNRYELLQPLEEDDATKPLTLLTEEDHRPLNVTKGNKKKTRSTGKSRILVLGSSHGRHLPSILQEQLGKRYAVSGFTKPNATLAQATADLGEQTKDFTTSDFVVIVAGTNDVNHLYHDAEERLETELEAIGEITSDTNLLFVNTFQRYDNLACNVKVNLENKTINSIMSRYKHVDIINTDKLNRAHFNVQGLHLNFEGKQQLCQSLRAAVVGKSKRETFLEKWLRIGK